MNSRHYTVLIALLVSLALPLSSQASNDIRIEVRGLFKGRAALEINGKQRLLKVGKKSPEGVLLVQAGSKAAIVEYKGERRHLTLSRKISSSYQKAEAAEVRLQSGQGGHYVTPGRINGLPVRFMVDTGATTVAMSLPQAKALGLNYRGGTVINVSTANGIAQAYRVMLSSVSIGSVKISNVEATVSMGNFPSMILLGNSYLGRVKMNRDDGVLVLTSKF